MLEVEKIKENIYDLKRNPKNNIPTIIAIILFIVCIYQTINIYEISKRNRENKDEISKMKFKNTEWENKYTKLEEEKETISEEYEELKSKYTNYINKVNNYVERRKSFNYSSPLISNLTSGSYIETRIDGNFDGWEGETIFKMQNGTIWQQASYAYKYHFAYSPKVLIYAKSNGTYLKVDGVNDEIRVKKIK